MKRRMPELVRIPDGIVPPKAKDPKVRALVERAGALSDYCEGFERDPERLRDFLDFLKRVSRGEVDPSSLAKSDHEILAEFRRDPPWVETNIRLIGSVLKGKGFDEILKSEWSLIIGDSSDGSAKPDDNGAQLSLFGSFRSP